MISRIRLYLCVLAAAALIAQLTPTNAIAAGDAHLAQNVTSSTPANGESVMLDSVDAFDPEGGEAVFDPDNVFAETFSYTGVDTETLTLLGVERLDAGDHPEGAVVRPATDVAPSPEPSPTGQPSALPPIVEPPAVDDGEAASPLPSPRPSPSEATDSGAPEDSPSPDEAEGSESVCQGVVCVPQECIDYPVTGDLMACVNALGRINAVCSSYDSCRAFLIETLCPVSAIFCNIPPPTPQVVAQVSFDDTLGYPSPYAPGCGLAGFYATSATGQRVANRSYIATATTLATLSAPQTYQGTLDGNGYAVLTYCPPPGLLINPFEVTFTATVDGVTGIAERAWSSNTQPTLPPLETTFLDQQIPPSPADELLGDTLIAVGGGPVGLETSLLDYPRNHTCYGYRTTYAKGARGEGDNAYYGVDTQLGAHAVAEAHSGGTTLTRRHSTSWALAGAGWKWYGQSETAYMSLPWQVVGSMSTSTQDVPFMSSSASALTEVFVGVRDNTTGTTLVEERIANWSQQGESFRDRVADGNKRLYFSIEHLHTYSGFIRVETTAETDTPNPYLASSSLNDFFSENRRAWLTYVAFTVPSRVVRCG